MRYPVLVFGLLLIVAGVYFVGPGSLSVVNQVSLTSLKVSCDSSSSCTSSVQVNNVNASSPLTLWFVVKNSASQAVFLKSQQVSVSPGSSTQVTQSLGSYAGGSYLLNVFALNSLGYPVSVPVQQSFSTGSFYLFLVQTSTGTFSYNPQGSACPSSVIQPGMQCSVYPAGSNVTISFAISNTAFTKFQYFVVYTLSSSLNAISGSVQNKNPFGLVMNANYEVSALTNYTQAAYYKTITPLSVQGVTYSPAGSQNIYPPNSGASYPSTVSFSMTAATGYNITGWTLLDSPVGNTVVSGTGTTATIKYSDLSSSNPYKGIYYLKAVVVNPVFVSVGTSPGVTTSPPAGNYYRNQGSQFTITETTSQGYCFTGWIVNGQNAGASSTLTVTLNSGGYSINPVAVPAPAGGCSSLPPPPPPSGSNSNALIGYGLVGAGVAAITFDALGLGGGKKRGRRR